MVVARPGVIPKLWHQTIQAHRREVRDAILDTAAALVAKHGLRAVTMSQIAEETGIGRATLYRYFSGAEPILFAWHERHVNEHLEHLGHLRDQPGDPASATQRGPARIRDDLIRASPPRWRARHACASR